MPAEYLQLASMREKVGPAPTAEEAHYMTDIFPSLRAAPIQILEANLRGEETGILSLLQETQRELSGNGRIQISRPRVCAEVVKTLGQGFVIRADHALGKNDLPGFRFNFDVSYGVGAPTTMVMTAEDQIRGNFGEEIAEVIPDLSEIIYSDSSMAGQAEQYAAFMRNADNLSSQIQNDKTGLTIVEDWVNKFRSSATAIHQSHSRTYIVAGAELARDLYIGLYQLAESLYPEAAK